MIETRNLLTKQIYSKEEELKAYLEERRLPAELKLRAKEAYNFYLARTPSFVEEGLLGELPREVRCG